MLARFAEALRRNHALEHATVAVLLAKHGPMRVAGRASLNGFLLYGDVDTEEITACAQEALRRLRAGEASLAVSPHCGTNIAVAGALAAAAATATVALGRPQGRFANAFMAAMLGVVAAQPLGHLVQEHLTTSPRLGPLEVVETREIAGNLRKVHTRGALD
ncbi:MAG: DUF6391 domain-containing protein [Dehalococcoidia bacterium]